MRRSKFKRPCKVLIFNVARVLVAIVRSLHCAAELTHENKSAIHNCCTGKSVRSGAYYYRQLHPDILLEMDDLDKLTLKEYDDLCGAYVLNTESIVVPLVLLIVAELMNIARMLNEEECATL